MQLTSAIQSLLLATAADGRSSKTVADYERKLRPFVNFVGDIDVSTITIEDLRHYIVHLQNHPFPFLFLSLNQSLRSRVFV